MNRTGECAFFCSFVLETGLLKGIIFSLLGAEKRETVTIKREEQRQRKWISFDSFPLPLRQVVLKHQSADIFLSSPACNVKRVCRCSVIYIRAGHDETKRSGLT